MTAQSIALTCAGKTLTALALHELYGWPFFQSDDIQQKKTADAFGRELKSLLMAKGDVDAPTSVVFADRNNHLLQHREQMVGIADALSKQHRIRLVALVYEPGEGEDVETMRQICSERIVGRGERHQSLRADLKTASHDSILARFLHERDAFDPVGHADVDGSFDEVIRVPVELDPAAMVRHVATALGPILDIKPPRPDRLDEAIEKARAYTPTVRKEAKDSRVASARYYGVAIAEADVNLLALVRTALGARGSGDQTVLLDALEADDAIERRPHVTLAHSSAKGEQEGERMWTAAGTLAAQAAPVDVRLGPRVAYDERVIAIEVDSIEPLPEALAHRFHHITVGHRKDARPIEGRKLFERLHDGQTQSELGGKIHVVELKALLPRVKGIVKALF